MDAQTLSDVMGGALPLSRYAELLPAYEKAGRDAGINNLERAAQWAAQLGHECVGLSALEEYASGAAYEGRTDLGNTFPGDGIRYKGRGAIMITGRANYRNLSAWAFSKGYVPTPTYFEENPVALQSNEHAFVGAVWYWTVARPGINAAADQGYTLDVTRMINGGTNGIDDRRARYDRAKAMGDRIIPGGSPVQTVEKVLDYSRAEITQDRYYWCGPATCQTIINSKNGQMIPEETLASELGTTVNGTDHVGLLRDVLNRRIGGGYRMIEMPNDPATQEQKDRLWNDIAGSIEGGQGVAVNIVAPPSNYPQASYTSTISPAYSGGTVAHYIAAMGYAVDSGGTRHVWIADSGFAPYGYWCSLDQLATLIPPKGYAYPADAWRDPQLQGDDDMTPEQAQQLAEVHRELTQPYPSRSKYRVDDRPVDTLAGMVLNIDGRIHEQHIERMAQSLGKTPEQVAQAIRDAVKAGK